MIQPISLKQKVNSLEPVRVPHFAGKSKISPKHSVSDRATTTFTSNVKDYTNAALKGAKKCFSFLKKGIQKAGEFLGAFFKSIFSDTKDIVKKKSANTVTSVDNVSNIVDLLN